MTELQENSRNFVMKECVSRQIDEITTPLVKASKASVDQTACPTSSERGDGSEKPMLSTYSSFVSNIGVTSLCSVDKMRMDHLVSELYKCMEAKRETEVLLKVSESEIEDTVKKFESCQRKHDADKENLESKLIMETMELNKLTGNTLYNLKMITDRISAWEIETSLIIDTVNELLSRNIHLDEDMIRMGIRTMLLSGEESRMQDRLAMEKLYSKKNVLKADVRTLTLTLTFDRGCQTVEKALL